MTPDYLCKRFQHCSEIHRRDTRQRSDLSLPKCRLATGQRVFAFLGPKMFNSLPKFIRDTESLNGFKKRIFKNIFNSLCELWVPYSISCISFSSAVSLFRSVVSRGVIRSVLSFFYDQLQWCYSTGLALFHFSYCACYSITFVSHSVDRSPNVLTCKVS